MFHFLINHLLFNGKITDIPKFVRFEVLLGASIKHYYLLGCDTVYVSFKAFALVWMRYQFSWDVKQHHIPEEMIPLTLYSLVAIYQTTQCQIQ